MQRRRFLHAVAAGGALALAGCSQDESNPFGEDTGTTPGDGGDGAVTGGDGSDGDGTGGNGDGASATTAGGGTAGDGGDGGSGGTDGGGGDGTDGGSGDGGTDGGGSDGGTDGGGETTVSDGSGDGSAEGTETGGDGTQTTVTNLDNPTIRTLDPTFETSFRFRADFSGYADAPDDASMNGAWHGGDFRGEWTAQGQTVEFYSVSNRTYIVADGSCTQLDSYPTGGVDTEDWVDTEDTEQRFNDLFDRQADGQTTIDGESMYVFELTSTEAGSEYDVTYYLSAATGYLRRVETNGVVLEYYDWGNVGPIQAPC
jgi:hypothetical protein